ncbi:aspartate kinase [Salegentibacter sp. JZCK2]|uniref:aspartate kinase n=1 Tax=Salegentibacter tibetensis TaxID=2873600 RepID=UPI001CCC0A3E|nr:aspartate kinase [Salegentibacter tibetensis]MBZ9728322.1 aspartate kinase [Salegentibacter tibetensis]
MKKVNIILFGIGNVGSTLIQQLLSAREQWEKHSGVSVSIPVIANSKKALYNAEGISENWQKDFKKSAEKYKLEDILDFTKENDLEHLIAIDATASKQFVELYIRLIQNGFNLVAANKVANTLSADFYNKLRKELDYHGKYFHYETNVGAGLPIVQTIQGLHQAGEKVTKIRGVFSGSLSFIFNTFSENKEKFSDVLRKAGKLGYTEPDSREDLSGNDVGRKLLILARELQLEKEFQEVKIQSLIPEKLNGQTSAEEFQRRIGELDEIFFQHKKEQNKDHVLRYIGEIEVGSASLEAKLISEPRNSALGQIKGADNIFEIYTESYGDQPLVIQGAGAGAAVTARGVASDVLKLSQRLN